jgi:hypothetical protein
MTGPVDTIKQPQPLREAAEHLIHRWDVRLD